MALIHDLPPEVLREIYIWVLLNDQSSVGRGGSFPALDINYDLWEESQLFRVHSLSKVQNDTFIGGLETVSACKAGATDGDLLHYHHSLYQEVCASRVMRDGILALNHTSKKFRDVARESLWRVVELGQGDEEGFSDVQAVLESVLNRPDLAKLVRNLSFRSCGIEDDFYSDFQLEWQLESWTQVARQIFVLQTPADEIDIYSCLRGWNVWLQLDLLLLLLPNLRSVKFFIDVPRSSALDISLDRVEGILDNSTQSIISIFANRLTYLNEFLVMIEEPDDGVSFDSRLLDIPFMIPSLRTVYFGTTFANDATPDTLYPSPFKNARKSAVTSLTIEQSLFSNENLLEILRFPKALKSFTFSYGGPSNHVSTAEAGQVCQALLPHRESLKKLHITGYHDTREEEQTPVDAILTQFPVLEDFAFPVGLLDITVRLSSVFPPSVQKLKLHLYDEWTLSSCWIEVQKMLGEKRDGRALPYLREVWIEYWISGDREEARDYSGWQSESVLMIEDMVRLAAGVGVKLEFILDQTSRTKIWS